MQAVILAAGQGSRLRPLTDHCPKCLVKVQGRSLLQYQLEALRTARISECVIVVGHRADQVRAAFGSRFGDLSITYVENDVFDRTNNIYSLWLARKAITQDVLLLEGDLIFDPELLVDLLDRMDQLILFHLSPLSFQLDLVTQMVRVLLVDLSLLPVRIRLPFQRVDYFLEICSFR